MRQKSDCRSADCIVLEDSHLIIVKFPDKPPLSDGKNQNAELEDGVKPPFPNKSVANLNKKTSLASESCESDEELENSYSEEEENENDLFWESLMKEPTERSPEDIKIIFNNIKGLPAFSCLTTSTVLAMCSVMAAAMVREAGQRVLHHGELMDTWSVILNGCIEITDPDGSIRELSRGDSFGVKVNQSTNPQKFRGDMFTVTEDCHFVCINQEDYIRIMDQEGQTQVTECGEGGRVLLVYEEIKNENFDNLSSEDKDGLPSTPTWPSNQATTSLEACPSKTSNLRVVTKGTPDKLIDHLMNELSQSQITAQASITEIQSYAEDFFLTYRTFLNSPKRVITRLLHWYKNNSALRLRVKRCVLLWIHQYFSDFEDNPDMIDFLSKFDQLLALYGNSSERRLLNLACSTRAKPRTYEFKLTVFRPKNPSKLTSDLKVFVPFIFIGNTEESLIFLKQVDTDFEEISIEPNPWPYNRVDHPILEAKHTNLDEFRHKKPLLRVGDQVIAFNNEILTTEPGLGKYQKPAHLLQAITNFASNNAVKIDDINQKVKTLTPQQQQIYQQGAHILQSCKIKLTLIYNPLQFNQLLNKLSTGSPNSPPIPPQRSPQNIPMPHKMSPSLNRKAALPPSHQNDLYRNPTLQVTSNQQHFEKPTSVSIPHGMSTDSGNDGSRFKIDQKKDRSSLQQTPIEKSIDDMNINSSLSSSHPDLVLASKSISSGSSANRSSPRNFFNSHQSSSGTTSRRNPLGGLLHAISHGNLAEDNAETSEHRHNNSTGGDAKSLWINNYTQSLTPHDASSDAAQVIRVWKASDEGREQSSKLVLIKPWTTAREAKGLALDEFGSLGEDPDNYSFYLVSVVTGPLLKASKIANNTANLANKISLNCRYYLRSVQSTEAFMSDDVIKSVLIESKTSLLQLDSEQLALMITSEDHKLFRNVEPSEYINEIFNLEPTSNTASINNADNRSSTGSSCSVATNKSLSSQSSSSNNTGYYTGTTNLTILTDLVNIEAYWAPTEICSEVNLVKRVEILKKFIKLVKYFRALRNYNAMFCLLMGLHQSSVERLRQTWDRLPNKYLKIFREVSIVLDTSRNFGHYRSLLHGSVLNKTNRSEVKISGQQYLHTPILPYLPLVMKDLTFIHLGNATKSEEGLINFVKLRMIAKEIRNTSRICSVDFDYRTSAELLNKSNLKEIFNPTTFTKNLSQTDSSLPTGAKTSRGAKAMRLMLQAAKITISNTLESQNDSGSSSRHRSQSTGNGNLPHFSGNPRKIYEQWQNHLQMKTYLNSLKVITNPDELMELSRKIEPPRNLPTAQVSLDSPPTNQRASASTADSISNDDSGLESEPNVNSNRDACFNQESVSSTSDTQVTVMKDAVQPSVGPIKTPITRQGPVKLNVSTDYEMQKMNNNNLLKHNSSIRESMQSLVPVPSKHQYHVQRSRQPFDRSFQSSFSSDYPRDQGLSFQKMIINRQLMEKTLTHQKYTPKPSSSINFAGQKSHHQNVCMYQANPTNHQNIQHSIQSDMANMKLCKKHASISSQAINNNSPSTRYVNQSTFTQNIDHNVLQVSSTYTSHFSGPLVNNREQHQQQQQRAHYMNQNNSNSQAYYQNNQMITNNGASVSRQTVSSQQHLVHLNQMRTPNVQQQTHPFTTSKYDPMGPQSPLLPTCNPSASSNINSIYDIGYKSIELSAAPGMNRSDSSHQNPPPYQQVYPGKTNNKSYDSFLIKNPQNITKYSNS